MSINPAGTLNYKNASPVNFTPVSFTPVDNSNDMSSQPATKDKVDIGGMLRDNKDNLKLLTGVAISSVTAPVDATIAGVKGANTAGLRGLGHCGPGHGYLKTKLLLASIIGGAAGMIGGPAGVALGLAGGPGVYGALSRGFEGMFNSAGSEIENVKNTGNKVQEYVTESLGETAGKAAGIATKAGLGAVSVPVAAATGFIQKGFEFANKAVGIKNHHKPKDPYANERTAVAGGAVVGGGLGAAGLGLAAAGIAGAAALVMAGPVALPVAALFGVGAAAVGAIGGAVAGAGAAGTAFPAAKKAVKAAEKAVKKGFKFANKLINSLIPDEKQKPSKA